MNEVKNDSNFSKKTDELISRVFEDYAVNRIREYVENDFKALGKKIFSDDENSLKYIIESESNKISKKVSSMKKMINDSDDESESLYELTANVFDTLDEYMRKYNEDISCITNAINIAKEVVNSTINSSTDKLVANSLQEKNKLLEKLCKLSDDMSDAYKNLCVKYSDIRNDSSSNFETIQNSFEHIGQQADAIKSENVENFDSIRDRINENAAEIKTLILDSENEILNALSTTSEHINSLISAEESNLQTVIDKIDHVDADIKTSLSENNNYIIKRFEAENNYLKKLLLILLTINGISFAGVVLLIIYTFVT